MSVEYVQGVTALQGLTRLLRIILIKTYIFSSTISIYQLPLQEDTCPNVVKVW